MADLVERVLQAAAEKDSKYKTIEVNKDIDLEIDEGNLLGYDPNPVDIKQFKLHKEQYLMNLARDNTQLLLNRIWQLPTEKVDSVVIAKLPDPKTPIPREKPVPKVKALTKWEEYARLKGITNKKKGRMVWDEQKNEYRPRWGYKRANDETQEWVLEVPQNADPMEDQFEKKRKEKRERVSKNELQRLRNIARSQKSKVPGVGLTPTDTPSKDHLSKALAVTKKSTASVGKFTESLPKEKPSKYTGKKRKFEPNYGDIKSEKKMQLDILNNLHNKQPRIDITKAVNQQQVMEEKQRSGKKNESNQKGKRRSKSGGRGGKGSAKRKKR